jgi:hypothetical protein
VVVPQGEVLEVVLQNLNANANNGDYTGANRTAQEQVGAVPRLATLARG